MPVNTGSIQLYPIQIRSQAPTVEHIPSAIETAVEQIIQSSDRLQKLKPGARIAITAGSRGIANYVEIMKAVVKCLQAKGYEPFLFSAMGSHGRGEASGQREVLDSLGITADAVHCPVSCSSELVVLDTLKAFDRSIPVYCAKEAVEADGVIVINRIKPHTSFRGDYESGLFKMMAVGMGRAKGADMFHGFGAGLLADMIPLIGRSIIQHAPIVGGIGIIENANERTAIIEGMGYEQIPEREKELLNQAKQFMPRLPVDTMDICIIEEMGKNYSGTGMDTNIIGRMRIEGIKEPEKPHITYLGVLRLSEASHGNANGIGLADLTTETLVQSVDKTATYLNCMTAGFAVRAAIPMTFPDDRALLEGALKMLRLKDIKDLRMVVIRNTLHIDHVWVTEAIYEDIKAEQGIVLADEPFPLAFDKEGNWRWNDVHGTVNRS
ncbi:lactate racemase domain-containing protein [Aneurinibacillus tyrosinisolvens]|uniref:lactate racemase domain-containing protein n=1 Tax=Aneurinibacillus tyrosinisolvens TaxID=1443435 RepID=UPI00069A6DAD|nr:lactate racemase domain-containing protein [Aneurinibacillus tyrosinisolvens]